MSDIRDILRLNTQPPGKSPTDVNLVGKNLETKRPAVPGATILKRISDVPSSQVSHGARLACLDALIPSGGGYKPKSDPKKAAQKWKWTPFINPARTDNAMLSHWAPVKEAQEVYPFSAFNKKLVIHDYSEAEYATHLDSYTNWTKKETDHLFDLCRRFDLRFPVIHDRWDKDSYGQRSMEEIKERYYRVDEIMDKIRGVPKKTLPVKYDAEYEKRRKLQLQKLWDRTPEQIQEEQYLKAQKKKIDAVKKGKSQKAKLAVLERQQELKELLGEQKNSRKIKVGPNLQEIKREQPSLIKPIDKLLPEVEDVFIPNIEAAIKIEANNIENQITRENSIQIQEEQYIKAQKEKDDAIKEENSRKAHLAHLERELKVQKLQRMIDIRNYGYDIRNVKVERNFQEIKREQPSPIPPVEEPWLEVEEANSNEVHVTRENPIQWPHSSSGVSLCSSKKQLPPTVGEKKKRAIKNALKKLNIDDKGPIATVDAVTEFNELRSDILEMDQLKADLANHMQQVKSLAARYKKKTNVKLELPDKLCGRHPGSVLTGNADVNKDNKPIDGLRTYDGED